MLLQRCQYFLAVAEFRHIDKIDYYDAADVTQTYLAGDFRGRLQVRFKNRRFLVAPPDKNVPY